MLHTADRKVLKRGARSLSSYSRSLIALGAAATLVLSGCAAGATDDADSTASESASEVTTIKLLHWEVGGAEFWNASISAFEEANPTIKVE